MEELATNNYIERGLNIIFVGASGCGKTWLSNALGVHACRNRKTVLYIRLPELFSKFEEKRIQGKYNEYLKRLGKYDLLIIDEFLLKPTNESERSDLLELMEIRCNKKSTIFCSQYSFLNCKMKLELRNWDKGACPFIPIRAVASFYSQFLYKKSP